MRVRDCSAAAESSDDVTRTVRTVSDLRIESAIGLGANWQRLRPVMRFESVAERNTGG